MVIQADFAHRYHFRALQQFFQLFQPVFRTDQRILRMNSGGRIAVFILFRQPDTVQTVLQSGSGIDDAANALLGKLGQQFVPVLFKSMGIVMCMSVKNQGIQQ